jgi:hypothetical protein
VVAVVVAVVAVVAEVPAVTTVTTVSSAFAPSHGLRAGEQAQLVPDRGGGGNGHGSGRPCDRRYVLLGECGCTRDQGACRCDGHQASGGVQLFSHVVSLSPGIGTSPFDIGALMAIYSFQYPGAIP